MARRRRTILRDGADPIDEFVGGRLRARRVWQKMNQTELGRAIDVTFQQVQKYENGTNRLSSSTLWKFAKALDVEVTYFFEEMPADVASGAKGLAEATGKHFESDQLSRRETLELVRAYYRIGNAKVRKRVFELVKAVGQSSKS